MNFEDTSQTWVLNWERGEGTREMPRFFFFKKEGGRRWRRAWGFASILCHGFRVESSRITNRETQIYPHSIQI